MSASPSPVLLRRLAAFVIRGPDALVVLADLEELFNRDVDRGLSRWRACSRYAFNTIASAYNIWRARRSLLGTGVGASLLDVKLGVRMLRKQPMLVEAGLEGVSRRRGTRTTRRGKDARSAPDLVDRDFGATGPDQLWVADITYIPTWAGFLYLAVVLDAWSRRVVGWAMATHLRTELVLDALNMALWQRRPEAVIHHSDQGSQYTSLAFGRRCKEARVRPSMGSVGDAYDNAMAESFFATLECELVDRRRFRTQTEARMAVFRFIEGWYNPHRRHSGLDYESPVSFETKHREAA